MSSIACPKRIAPSVDHAPFGSKRNRSPFSDSATARYASSSKSGGKTPPLSLCEVNPYRALRSRALATSWSTVRTSPAPSAGLG